MFLIYSGWVLGLILFILGNFWVFSSIGSFNVTNLNIDDVDIDAAANTNEPIPADDVSSHPQNLNHAYCELSLHQRAKWYIFALYGRMILTCLIQTLFMLLRKR